MASEPPPKTQTNIYSELLKLSSSLAPWQNEILRRIFNKGELSPSDKQDILQLALIHYGLEKRPDSLPNLMLTPGDLPSPPTPGQQIKLRSIGGLTNVNALRDDQRLGTGDQLTIIYGENATGKSGYARVMKKAFRARAVDDILPNVYDKTSPTGSASATFEIEESGAVRKVTWIDGGEIIECLGRFAVFDSHCGRVYLTDDNQLSFLPYGFDMLECLTKTTDEVKAELQSLGLKAAPNADALKPLLDDTAIGKLLASVTASTDEKDIESKAVWTDDDNAKLATMETELAQLKLNSPKTVRTNLESIKKNLERMCIELSKLQSVTSTSRVEVIKKKCDELKKYEEAVEAARQKAFSDIELDGVGSPVWQELIRAAAKYSMVAYLDQPFPATGEGAKCVLCQQSLDQTARDRLKRFWAFIQNEMSTKRDLASTALALEKEALTKLPSEAPEAWEAMMDPLRAYGSKVPGDIAEYFPLVSTRIASLKNAIATNNWDSLVDEPVSPKEMCSLEILALDEKLASLADDEKMEELIKSLSKEIGELKARGRLKTNLSLVLDHVRSLKRSRTFSDAASKINTTALTKTAKDLHKKLVTDEFRNSVRDRLIVLGHTGSKAAVNEKPQKGKVLHRITVTDAPSVPPDKVFSEGERTAVALACFIAELTISNDNCAIVLDDPVSSLDHRVQEGVAKLLISEAKKRQVIIFTHDLVFYRELVSVAKRQSVDVTFQHIQSIGNNFGLVSDQPPWYAMKVGQRITLLEGKLADAKQLEAAGDIENYRSRCHDFYDLLRSTWERSIEELLFNGVIQRFERDVASLKLTGVSIDTKAIEDVFDGMTRTSAMIDAHDPATAKGKPLANSTELQKDLQDIKEFKSRQSQKIKEAEAALDHLTKSKPGK